MKDFFHEHGTKLYGSLTSFFATLQLLISADKFKGLLSPEGIGWLDVITALAIGLLGGMTVARGFTNTTAVRVAEAMQTAINTQPPGTVVRTHGLLVALCLLVVCIGLSACSSTPSGGGHELSTTGKVALREVTAIAVRRSVAESPRAIEKAQNIREIATRLYDATSIATVTDLRAAVDAEVAKLSLNPVDRADANSLLNIFEALLRERLGTDELNADALVTVNEFLAMIVSALPAV